MAAARVAAARVGVQEVAAAAAVVALLVTPSAAQLGGAQAEWARPLIPRMQDLPPSL